MSPAITINKKQHRFDSKVLPLIRFSDFGSFPKLFIREYLYVSLDKFYFIWEPPNRTDFDLSVALRLLGLHTWTLSSGVTNISGNFTKNSSAGFSGATGAEIETGNCSIEGKPENITGSCAFALQSGTESFDYESPDIEHVLCFEPNKSGSIRENGEVKYVFKWNLGDSGLIERYGDVVRYYLVKQNGEMILLRSKRSLLAEAVVPTIVLKTVGSGLSSVRVWDGIEVSETIDLFGVLENFQNWQNAGSWESLAEKTTNKDKSEDFTYFSTLKSLMNLSVQIAWDEGEEYRKFLEFFKWHDVSREFFYIDNARATEFSARFATSFADSPLGADIYGMSAEIKQITDPRYFYQTDVPYELPDTIAPDTPSAPVLSLSTSRTIIVDGDVPLDNDDYFYYYV